jgi:hypothetical protein
MKPIPKVGSNVIVPVPVGAGPNKPAKYEQDIFHRPCASAQPTQGLFKLKMRSNKMSNKPVNMNKLPSTDLVQVLNRLNDFCSPQAQM